MNYVNLLLNVTENGVLHRKVFNLENRGDDAIAEKTKNLSLMRALRKVMRCIKLNYFKYIN